MSKKNNRRKRAKKRMSRKSIYIMIIVAFVVLAMGAQTFSLLQKRAEYQAKEKALEKELETQQERQQELADYEQYVQTDEYIEQTAKEKLGLVYENEIIFREND